MKKITKIIIILFLIGIATISPTFSYYSDTENSEGNSFSATSLDFSLFNTDSIPIVSSFFNTPDILPGYSEIKTLKMKKESGLDFKYNLTAAKTSGDDTLCNALNIEAKLEGVSQYNGNLFGLSLLTPALISVTGEDNWEFTVSLSRNDTSLRGLSCGFDIIFSGWQEDSDGSWGFGDEEALENLITSGAWAREGGVVINELMWMGSSGNSDDEWIELRNTTASPVVLDGWEIENARTTGSNPLALSGTIPANGYFLISHYDSAGSAINDTITVDLTAAGISLVNTGEQLTLKSDFDVIIDQTPVTDGDWAVGENGGQKKSMERNAAPGSGTNDADWHPCEATECNDTTYWDVEGDNYGTPKAENKSENDPTMTESESGQEEIVLEITLEIEESEKKDEVETEAEEEVNIQEENYDPDNDS